MRTAKQRAGTPLAGIEEEEALIVEMAGLNHRQTMFVHAYMRSFSGSRAFVEAGYGSRGHNAAVGSARLLAKGKVREVVNALMAGRIRRIQATPQRIEEELAKVAFASLGRVMVVQGDGTAYLDFTKADEGDLAGLKKFKCEILHRPGDTPDDPKQVLKMEAELGDKLAALTMLARIHKMIGGDEGVSALVDIADAIRQGRKRAGLK